MTLHEMELIASYGEQLMHVESGIATKPCRCCIPKRKIKNYKTHGRPCVIIQARKLEEMVEKKSGLVAQSMKE
jgi:predicted alternative tryptophan synthase beta-subunit